ncbi:hypothetical protein Acsp06_11630 [Actinomycetospora sp. NBRC 106375]|uniref:hypothetical protein n=1 Tax=Actinomycetospora sp. NBRC 106375 TaxID=3032207 RepID=UPI0024A070CF|nr:hypothetical protein [Actinomycetospora sp. NBRC 106375]GLZ44978.1 hypothetical protein Acsp06_11630 [Actinomycetospora sp. NBRC 106375]
MATGEARRRNGGHVRSGAEGGSRRRAEDGDETPRARRSPEQRSTAQRGGGEAASRPDVYLDVPKLEVDHIGLKVEDLRAKVSLQAEVLDLLKLNVGVDAQLGSVELEIDGVSAEATLKVRLDEVAAIIDRVLTTIDRNPAILETIARTAQDAVREVGSGVGEAVGEVGSAAGSAVEELGGQAGSAVGELGTSVGDAAGELGGSVGDAAGDAVDAVGSVGETAADAAAGEVGSAAGDVAGEVAATADETASVTGDGSSGSGGSGGASGNAAPKGARRRRSAPKASGDDEGTGGSTGGSTGDSSGDSAPKGTSRRSSSTRPRPARRATG